MLSQYTPSRLTGPEGIFMRIQNASKFERPLLNSGRA